MGKKRNALRALARELTLMDRADPNSEEVCPDAPGAPPGARATLEALGPGAELRRRPTGTFDQFTGQPEWEYFIRTPWEVG